MNPTVKTWLKYREMTNNMHHLTNIKMEFVSTYEITSDFFCFFVFWAGTKVFYKYIKDIYRLLVKMGEKQSEAIREFFFKFEIH